MAIITITRGLYSGGEEIAESLAKKLGAQCINDEVLLEAAKKYQVDEKQMGKLFQDYPSFWERITESRRIHLAYLQATLAEYASSDSLVYHGNGGQELLREIPHVLKVRLVFPVPLRVARIQERFGHSQEKADAMVKQIDDERTKRTQYLFNSDWRDVARYDLVIRLERISSAFAEETIINLLKQPEFQLSESKKSDFDDFLLKNRIHAQLANSLVGRMNLIQVQVYQGEVTLQGALTTTEHTIDSFVSEISAIEGVRSVRNEVVSAPVYQEWNI